MCLCVCASVSCVCEGIFWRNYDSNIVRNSAFIHVLRPCYFSSVGPATHWGKVTSWNIRRAILSEVVVPLEIRSSELWMTNPREKIVFADYVRAIKKCVSVLILIAWFCLTFSHGFPSASSTLAAYHPYRYVHFFIYMLMCVSLCVRVSVSCVCEGIFWRNYDSNIVRNSAFIHVLRPCYFSSVGPATHWGKVTSWNIRRAILSEVVVPLEIRSSELWMTNPREKIVFADYVRAIKKCVSVLILIAWFLFNFQS